MTDMMKHSKINDASRYVEQAKWDLQKFQRELKDVNLPTEVKIEIGGFLSFADFFLRWNRCRLSCTIKNRKCATTDCRCHPNCGKYLEKSKKMFIEKCGSIKKVHSKSQLRT